METQDIIRWNFFATQGFTYEAGFNITEFLIDTVSQSSEACTSYHAKFLCAVRTSKRLRKSRCSNYPRTPSPSTMNRAKDLLYAHGPLTELWIMTGFKDGPMALYGVLVYEMWPVYDSRHLLSLFFYQQDRAPSGILNLNGIAFIACISLSFMAQVHTEEVKNGTRGVHARVSRLVLSARQSTFQR